MVPRRHPETCPRSADTSSSPLQVAHLRNNAKLMARSTGLHVRNDNMWLPLGNGDFQHGDFEFFLRRMAAI